MTALNIAFEPALVAVHPHCLPDPHWEKGGPGNLGHFV